MDPERFKACPWCGEEHAGWGHLWWGCSEFEASRPEGGTDGGPPADWPPCLANAALAPAMVFGRGLLFWGQPVQCSDQWVWSEPPDNVWRTLLRLFPF
eukprot:12900305-Alexandrium_andersonii.AAC.1